MEMEVGGDEHAAAPRHRREEGASWPSAVDCRRFPPPYHPTVSSVQRRRATRHPAAAKEESSRPCCRPFPNRTCPSIFPVRSHSSDPWWSSSPAHLRSKAWAVPAPVHRTGSSSRRSIRSRSARLDCTSIRSASAPPPSSSGRRGAPGRVRSGPARPKPCASRMHP